jgi:hypothetical protein
LPHVGHAQDADSLIGQNNLHTVNTVGLYAVEDDKFCRDTQAIIQECVKAHNRGASVKVEKTLPSSTTRLTQVTIVVLEVIAAVTAGGSVVIGR